MILYSSHNWTRIGLSLNLNKIYSKFNIKSVRIKTCITNRKGFKLNVYLIKELFVTFILGYNYIIKLL